MDKGMDMRLLIGVLLPPHLLHVASVVEPLLLLIMTVLMLVKIPGQDSKVGLPLRALALCPRWGAPICCGL